MLATTFLSFQTCNLVKRIIGALANGIVFPSQTMIMMFTP